jgi:hypothetical protein
MCQSCIDIDTRIDEHRKQLRAVADREEIARIERLIYELYGERVRKHQSPEK